MQSQRRRYILISQMAELLKDFDMYVPGANGPLINPAVLGFNYDTAQGVEYRIDVSRPVGSRIVDLRYKGATLAPDRRGPWRVVHLRA